MNEKYMIAVVGFDNVEKAVAALRKVMEREGIWLFTLVGDANGVSKEVAKVIGAPFQCCKSIKELEWQCNYLLADVSAGQEVKNMVMRVKAAGKHGYVVR